jgi:hypothetical protein
MFRAQERFRQFLDQVKDKGPPDIIQAAGAEYSRHWPGGRRSKGREQNAEYQRLLGGLLFFVGNGITPWGLSDPEFQALRPVCEALVKKKQLKPAVLKLFDQRADMPPLSCPAAPNPD